MQQIKIQSNSDTVHINCPSCDNWEQLGIDDPRKMLNALPIIDWLPDGIGNEVSKNKCSNCKVTFRVEWDYENPLIGD